MEESKPILHILAAGTTRASFVALVAYYGLALYLVPSSATIDKFSFSYFALVIPAWLYLAGNRKYLFTGYSTASKFMALFAILAGTSGVLREDYSLAYNAAFLSAMAIVILNSRVYLTIAELNWLFLGAVLGAVIVHVMGITEYGFLPRAKVGNCEDVMNWRVSLFRVTAESAVFSLIILIANLSYENRLRGWVRGLTIFTAVYFLIFSGVRSAVLAAVVVAPICTFAALKHLSGKARRHFSIGMAIGMIFIISLPYLLGRGEGFWTEYVLRTGSCSYVMRYMSPGHSESVVTDSKLSRTETGAEKVTITAEKPVEKQLTGKGDTVNPQTPIRSSNSAIMPDQFARDWIVWTLNRQCAAVYQISLLTESLLGSRDIQPKSDQQLVDIGCAPKQFGTYCASCTFATYWLARAGIMAIPLLLCFVALVVSALISRKLVLTTVLMAFGIISIGWGGMYVPYNLIFLLMMAMPAFVAANEGLSKNS